MAWGWRKSNLYLYGDRGLHDKDMNLAVEPVVPGIGRARPHIRLEGGEVVGEKKALRRAGITSRKQSE